MSSKHATSHHTKVTPQHTLERVRNNQRRHRERRRDHIATLEEKLRNTEKDLKDARDQVVALKKKVEKCQCGNESISQTFQPLSTVDVQSDVLDLVETSPKLDLEALLAPKNVEAFAASLQIGQAVFEYDNLPARFDGNPALVKAAEPELPTFNSIDSLVLPGHVQELPSLSPEPVSKLPSSCCFRPHIDQGLGSSAVSSSYPSTSTISPRLPHMQNSLYMPSYSLPGPTSPISTINPLPFINTPDRNLEPNLEPNLTDRTVSRNCGSPSTGFESTMLCKHAYQLISTQNYKGLSQFEVVSWLSSGFRWPRTDSIPTDIWTQDDWGDAEEGCRVETTVVFGLLTFISEF